jgi:hypothetical protein
MYHCLVVSVTGKIAGQTPGTRSRGPLMLDFGVISKPVEQKRL